MTFTDLLEDASPQEREYFTANFLAVPFITLCRRLRRAEWNEKYGKEEIVKLKARIRELEKEARPSDLNTPPDGWELPKAAADLLACAQEHGWMSLTVWGERSDEPSVKIQLAHKAADGRVWRYDHLTWIASGSGRSMKRFGSGLQSVPGRPMWHDAASIKGICDTIAANPA